MLLSNGSSRISQALGRFNSTNTVYFEISLTCNNVDNEYGKPVERLTFLGM